MKYGTQWQYNIIANKYVRGYETKKGPHLLGLALKEMLLLGFKAI